MSILFMVVVATIKNIVVAYLTVIEGSLIEPYTDWCLV